LLAVVGFAIAAVRSNDVEDTFAGQVEDYTSCLRDNGAAVPQFEALADGGFRITFDGSVFDGGLDFSRLREAHVACAELTPDLELLLGGFAPDLLRGLSEFDVSPRFDERFTPRGEHDRRERRRDDRSRGFGGERFDLGLEEACELLEAGELPDGLPRIGRLRELCEDLQS
jgi:hypothetical protein